MGGRAVPTLRSPYSLFPTHYPPYFHILAHSLAISCTFLHLRKSQLFSFHGIAHSSTKNRGWGTPAASTLTPARITESDAQIAGSQSRVTLLFIPQSAGFARTATRCRSTVHRSGTPCVPPYREFLRHDTCASFPSR